MLNNGHGWSMVWDGDFEWGHIHKNIRSIGINWIGFKCQISLFLNIHIYIFIYNIHIYICHIYIYQFKAANVRCLFFSAELSVGKKHLPRFPEVSLSCSSWDRLFLRLKKNTACMVEVYTVYIYNVVESRKNPIYHIFMVDFYIHMING
jgi:hypothetical protein